MLDFAHQKCTDVNFQVFYTKTIQEAAENAAAEAKALAAFAEQRAMEPLGFKEFVGGNC